MTLWGGANRFVSGFARRAAGHRRFQKFAPMHVIVSLSQLPAVHEQQDTVDIAGIIRRDQASGRIVLLHEFRIVQDGRR